MTRRSDSYNEKRSFIRMKMDTPVSLTLSDGQTMEGFCRDLSGAGMLLETDRELAPGTTITLAITSGEIPFHANAEVVRTEPSGSDRVILGLSITDILDQPPPD